MRSAAVRRLLVGRYVSRFPCPFTRRHRLLSARRVAAIMRVLWPGTKKTAPVRARVVHEVEDSCRR